MKPATTILRFVQGSVALLALGALSTFAAPTATAAPTGAPLIATKVVAGRFHTCALTAGGGVKCWGAGFAGQLGSGAKQPSAIPQDVHGLGSGVKDLAAGGDRACALLTSGAIRCWGKRFDLLPKDVAGFESGDTVTTMAIGDAHVCVLLGSGKIKCWGEDREGQLGDGQPNLFGSAAQPGAAIAGLPASTAVVAGRAHTCALAAGEVWCWGDGGSGQNGSPQARSLATPTKVVGLAAPVTGLFAHEDNTCAVLQGGKLRCWGDSWWGQLGTTDYVREADPLAPAEAVDGGVSTVAVGRGHICALKGAGASQQQLLCFGDRLMRQIGDSTQAQWFTPDIPEQWFAQRATKPVALPGLPALKSVASGHKHLCGLDTAGRVSCWGYNAFGQLGDGSIAASGTPRTVLVR